jgi:hypothetical protein
MNPYELRFSILNTAKDFLESQYKANLTAWELADVTAKKALDLAPKFPTMEEVIEKAIEINKFVSETGEQELINTVKRMTRISVPF